VSIAATRAVRARSAARGSARLVLLEFADFANDAGRCWPSAATIAKGCNCSERTAYRLIAQLVAAGELIPVDTRPRGVVEYQIAACLPPDPCQNGSTPDNPVRGASSTTPDTVVSGQAATPDKIGATPDNPDTRPLTTLSDNPSIELLEPRSEEASAQQAVSIFNELAGELGLVRVRRLTEKRLALLAARLAECGGLEGWATVLARIRASPGLCGECTSAWKPDIDWILDETNFARLAEGRYDGWSPGANGAGRRQSPQEKLVAAFAVAARGGARGQP
jgi:hypothetical protein